LRDDALLKSAPARPQQHFAYGNPSDIIAMATANYWGIVRNHPFVDGNKRTGFVVGVLFLELKWISLHRQPRGSGVGSSGDGERKLR
jgi:death-on-curing protein